MLGHYIANFVMLPPRHSKEETIQIDTDWGFGDAFRDYNELWDRHEFSVKSDDAVICGEYVINPKDNGTVKKVAIISHGTTSIRDADVKYGKMFYDKGFNLVIFDQRYFGASKAPYCTLGDKEASDLKKVISFAKETFGEDAIIGLHGESMGAAASIKCLDTETPDFVIADCPFCDLGMLIRDLVWKKAFIIGPISAKIAVKLGLKRYGYDYTKVRPIDSLENSNVPICFMHGNEDSLINKKHSELMFAKCKNKLSEIHFFDGADHATSVVVATNQYREIMYSFIDKIIK